LKVIKSKNAHLSEQSIEDLHQNVFLSLFDRRCRKLRQYKGKNGCSLASWVRLVTGNMVLDYLRRGMDALAPRQQIMPLEMAAELNAPEPLPIDQLTAAEQWQQIENGLRHLKTRDQLIVRLHCLDEQPLSDVAKILGVSEKNMHSVKHRAIKRLKTVIVGKKKE
jgi:RNA polymerase sigma factor (sigma-70 family)